MASHFIPGLPVSLQRKKRCQQIIGLNDESFSIAVRIDAEKEFVVNLSLRSLLFVAQVRLARLARSPSSPWRRALQSPSAVGRTSPQSLSFAA